MLRIRRFLRRVTPLTWAIWLLLVADLLEPGYLKFDFLVARVDATAISGEANKVIDAVTNANQD